MFRFLVLIFIAGECAAASIDWNGPHTTGLLLGGTGNWNTVLANTNWFNVTNVPWVRRR